MLISMTGFGEGSGRDNDVAATFEVRSINSRHFKLSLRTPDGLGSLEPKIEEVIRSRIQRGTVYGTLRVDRESGADACRVNPAVLQNYIEQLRRIGQVTAVPTDTLRLDALAALPGVIEERTILEDDGAALWPLVETIVGQALDRLCDMRAREGRAMASDLLANCQAIAQEVDEVDQRAPQVVEDYRQRITERLTKLLEERSLEMDPAVIVREVAVFADRCDISEEVVRLRSHLKQFESAIADGGGKRLEFLTQELFREANTIGSKANDAEIARHVVEMKTAIERIREMVQNVE